MVVVFSWEGGVSEGGFGQPTASDLQVHHHIRLDFSFWSYPTHLHYVRIKLLLYRKSQEQPWNYMYSVSKSGKTWFVTPMGEASLSLRVRLSQKNNKT